MVRKRELRDTVIRLTNRIAELEERLCPFESHQWVKIDYSFEGGHGVGDETILYKYKCRKCGKVVRTWKLFREASSSVN